MVFQYPEYQLFEETVMKDICFGPKNQGLSEEEALERAREAAYFVDLKRNCGKNPRLNCPAGKSAGPRLPGCWPWTRMC